MENNPIDDIFDEPKITVGVKHDDVITVHSVNPGCGVAIPKELWDYPTGTELSYKPTGHLKVAKVGDWVVATLVNEGSDRHAIITIPYKLGKFENSTIGGVEYEEPLFDGTYITVNNMNWIKLGYYDNMDYYIPAMKFKQFVEMNGMTKEVMMNKIDKMRN